MRSEITTYLLIVTVISCNPKKESINKTSSNKEEVLTPIEISIKKNYCSEIGSIAELNGEIITIKLSEEDLKNPNFQEVQDDFYSKFIENNGMFRKKSNSYKQGGIDTKHYYFGKVSQGGNCLVVIYEYFILNYYEGKLFLLVVDEQGNLRNTIQVSELTPFAGGIHRKYSVLNENNLRIMLITEEVLGEYNEESNQYSWIMDSVATSFKIESWESLRFVSSDTTKNIKYWK